MKKGEIKMEKIRTEKGYDFYEGDGGFNIVPTGSPAPAGGYIDPRYILSVKGIIHTNSESEAANYFRNGGAE
jgi:hypothetical protein